MRYLKIISQITTLIAMAWIIPQHASAQHTSVSFQLFYDELSPYGMWVDSPNYGYIWIPQGDPGFSPYETSGYWVFTDDGWTWVSDYPWGWAAFHYGRWDYENSYGWYWVPDEEWGPAWVSWRRSPGYYGWAPLRPGISINISFGSDYHERNERWIFVRDRDITRSDVSRHYINRKENITIINNSTVIVNTRRDDKRNATYIAGPKREDVQTVTRTRINPIAIRENDKPGSRVRDGGLEIYRPQVQKRSDDGRKPVPTKLTRLNDINSAAERNVGNRQRDINPNNQNQIKQQPGSRKVTPSNNDRKERQPQSISPPNNRVKENQPQSVSPPNNRGKGKQPQTIAPPNQGRKKQPSQPKPTQDKQEKRKRDG